jgi:hypothetical protein
MSVARYAQKTGTQRAALPCSPATSAAACRAGAVRLRMRTRSPPACSSQPDRARAWAASSQHSHQRSCLTFHACAPLRPTKHFRSLTRPPRHVPVSLGTHPEMRRCLWLTRHSAAGLSERERAADTGARRRARREDVAVQARGDLEHVLRDERQLRVHQHRLRQGSGLGLSPPEPALAQPPGKRLCSVQHGTARRPGCVRSTAQQHSSAPP